MKKYDLIIFDLDDTLFDYKATEYQALCNTCKKYNITFDESVYTNYKKANNKAKEMIADYILWLDKFRVKRAAIFLEILGRQDVSVPDFINTYLKQSEYGVLIEGVQELIGELGHVRKVIGTNGSTYPRRNKLENSSIAGCFTCFYSSEMLGVAKPDPEFFIKICEKEGVETKKTLVVGDNPKTDMYGAYKAGIDVCLIIHNELEYEVTENCTVISDIRELLGVV